jgi:hypothetical protein
MIDRLFGSRFVVVARIGASDLGESTVAIDDDAVSVGTLDAGAEVPARVPLVRVPLAAIERVVLNDGEIVLPLGDGTHITFVSSRAAELRDEILGRCRALPELTHALRAFGSRRGHRGTRAMAANDQRKFFAPLLDARRQAMTAPTSDAAMAAFDAELLGKAFEAELHGFAAERYGDNAPARRALEAELVDLTEPLRTALSALGDAAREASSAADDLRVWRLWARQLGATFQTADRVWLSLDVALDSDPWTL